MSYTYDEAGDNIAKTINQKSAQYEYDEEHRLIKESDEYGYTNEYEYDAFGNRITWEKSDGTTINYAYDALGNKTKENETTYTYDSRNNLLTATNREGTITHTYDAFNQITSTIDTKGNEITYAYDENQNPVEQSYAGTTIKYTYDNQGRISEVRKDDEIIAQYAYNQRNELIKQIQNDIITTKNYDEMGRIISQNTQKGDEVLFHASYTYDANDNLIEETINGHTDTYQYNAYDELIESVKYTKGETIKTSYQYDIYGNQIIRSNKEGIKTTVYNDKNQIEHIETESGTTYFKYDDNGNLAKKINEDGRVDYYTYDDLNQLIRLEQGSDIYEYRYDGEKERIEQTYTDTKDYHIEVWYNEREPFTIVKEEEIEETFLELREKVERQEIEKVCEPNEEITKRYQSFELRHELFSIETLIDLIRYYVYPKDEVYYREAQTTEYIVDRNREYSEVLAENETIHVYGNTLIESDNSTIITGWNNNVILEVNENETKTYRYDDYGNSEDRKQGHGYKQEIKDQSGLIYNRARYYDPKMGRFIQIDNHYQGESDNIASQNRYAYCLNNPYKYVDRDGNSPFSMLGGGGSSNLKNAFNQGVSNVVKTITQAPVKGIQKTAGNSQAIAAAVSKASSVGQAKLAEKTTVPVYNTNVNISKIAAPAKKAVEILKCPKKEEKWYEQTLRGIHQLGDILGRNFRDAGDWIWSKVKQTGSYIVEGFKNIMSMLDDILDTVARYGAVIAFVSGIVAVGVTFGARIKTVQN